MYESDVRYVNNSCINNNDQNFALDMQHLISRLNTYNRGRAQ